MKRKRSPGDLFWKCSNILINSSLSLTVLAISASEVPSVTIHRTSYGSGDLPKIHPLQSFTYDDVLDLIEEIEEGDLENRCSEAQLNKITEFVALLAREGVLPEDVNEKSSIEDDVRDLLQLDSNRNEILYSLYRGGENLVIPSVYYGQGDIMLCRSWAKKKWDNTRHFVKKHKTAIIIGAAVVVAVVVVCVVVASVGTASTVAGAAGAGVGGLSSSDIGHSGKSPQEGETTPSSPPPQSEVQSQSANLTEIFDEQVSSLKEMIVEDVINTSDLAMPTGGTSLIEKARELGSFLAHETLDGVSQITSAISQLANNIKDLGEKIFPNISQDNELFSGSPTENHESLVATGHEKIDQAFSTDQAGFYTPEAKEVGNNFVVGIIPFPGIFSGGAFNANKLSEAGKALDRAGFTRAGRGLMKHGYREGSVFPKPIGNPAQVNEHGQKVLESILNHPEKKLIPGEFERFGKVVDVYAPGIGGARYTAEGEFIGFLEP